MAEYRIFSRNTDLTKNAEITDFSSLEFVSRFNLEGRWKMTGIGQPPFALNSGIIVERDSQTVFSGIVRKAEKRMDAESFIKKSWTFAGVDDLGMIAKRRAHPDPVNLTISAQTYDVRTGAAETVILAFVEANCGSTAHISRRFTGFQVATSQGRGATIPGSARFYNLLEFIYNLARQSGDIGYRVRLDQATNTLVFEVYEPIDHSNDIIFSTEFGNLSSFAYMFEAPEANAIFTLGQGTGTNRAYYAGEDAASIAAWGRLETVKDQRNEPDAANLPAWAEAELSEAGEQHGFAVSPLALGSVGFVYGLDYNLGDYVTVADDGFALSERVTEIRVSLDESGVETITPTIGMLKDIPLKDTFEAIEDLEDRVGNLEASQ